MEDLVDILERLNGKPKVKAPKRAPQPKPEERPKYIMNKPKKNKVSHFRSSMKKDSATGLYLMDKKAA